MSKLEQSCYLFVRMLNSSLGIAWGFLFTIIMIRVIGVNQYSWFVLVSAIGLYLTSSDLGVANLVYARLRTNFLLGNIKALQAPVQGAVVLYFGVATAAFALFGVYAIASISPAKVSVGALVLFALGTAAGLPWALMRSVSAAVNQHLEYEVVDFLRRIGQLVIICCLMMNCTLEAAFLGCDLLWLASIAIVLRRLRSTGLIVAPRSLTEGRRQIGEFARFFGPDIGHSTAFSLSEAAIYNFPYVLLPLLYGAGGVVVFDVFNKFVRAAITVNQGVSLGFLPQVSHAYVAQQSQRLTQWLCLTFALSLVAMVTMTVITISWREDVFFLLMHDNRNLITTDVVVAIIVFSIANAIQNTAGSFIFNVGLINLAKVLALVMVAMFAAMTAILFIIKVSIGQFILCYALIYLIGAVAWGGYGVMLLVGLPGTTERAKL